MLSKNIVVFSDGTNQEGGKRYKRNSNVYKLFNMIEDRTDRQIAFYDRGLGTGWRKFTGSTFGVGISQNILECYEFIFNEFNAGDQIYLFGFSRGAATMRSLSNLIHLFGILPRSRPELIKRAYREIYKKENKRPEHAKDFVDRHHTMWPRIKFLGVWDTVAALGIPIKSIDVVVDKFPIFRHEFQDMRLSDSVEHARQALAIDDERLTFHPRIWNQEIQTYQTLKQVWFSGMHTDVGGGYKEQELSDIALGWMVHEAMQHGLRLYPRNEIRLKPDHNGKMHNSRLGVPGRFYRRRTRNWDSTTRGKPTVHESVLLRELNRENTRDYPHEPWILKSPYDVEPWPTNMRDPGRLW